MKKLNSVPGFTILEMIIAITVFTIFIGFVIATYLSFHRANQEALVERSVMLELQGTMNTLTEAVRENAIDYTAYEAEDPTSGDPLSPFAGIDLGSNYIEGTTLRLRDSDGTDYVYSWDSETEVLSVQAFDLDGKELEGYEDPIPLHSEAIKVSYVKFRIFPDVNPYEAANVSNSAVQYQPTVQMELTFTAPGRVREELSINLKTSVTSRFYQ